MEINEKEFAVIREITNQRKPTQRSIAQRIGISLGLTNLIIKRLIKKGYIKIQEAPPRTVIYTLTPRGLAEKTKKSYQFTLRTINIIKNIRENIQNIITKEYQQGTRDFFICGNGELAALTEIVIRDSNFEDIKYSRVKNKSNNGNSKCSLMVKKNGNEKKIDILSELSKGSAQY